MTNTYQKNDTVNEKTLEELRLIRCLLERFLMVKHPPEFKDYQLEKFSPAYQHK